MAKVLNRTTKQFLPRANTPDYSPVDWIINPDMSAVEGFSAKYWVITGDTVYLMSQAERDAVDAAEVEAQKDVKMARLDNDEILSALIEVIADRSNATGQGQGLPSIAPVDIRAAVRGKL